MAFEDLAYVVRGYLKMLLEAQALSAKRGGAPIDLSYTVAKLTMWLRAKNNDFRAWDNLIQDASGEHMVWLNWYGRWDETKG